YSHLATLFLLSTIPPPPQSTLFPYTTLFRSEKGPAAALIGKFKSIQSAMIAAVSLLILGAVATVTLVSMNFTRSTIFENSSLYTRTIIRQMNQNIDSYIEYMENRASIVFRIEV